ncbi:DUF6302 family protein [Streptomyces sp. NPDC051569]|uniref:DUF6302 family protein n=1 Tax=Streptomyces sp. NPDC051569 TaxID=3365661 RepID=UPI003795FA16
MTELPPSAYAHTLSLRPAEEAYDFAFFRDRIADPELLTSAVAVPVCGFRPPALAVPASGKRRGGFLSYDLLTLAVAARDLLSGRPGFPNLRVRWSWHDDTCHTVEWGEPLPPWWTSDAAFGRFYGYSEDAIGAFLLEHPPTPSPVAAVAGSLTTSWFAGKGPIPAPTREDKHHVRAHPAVSAC